jgi:hypothetical protein
MWDRFRGAYKNRDDSKEFETCSIEYGGRYRESAAGIF